MALRDLSPRRRALVLGVLASCLLVAAVVAVRLIAHTPGPPIPQSVDQARPGTVILVPGYGGSQAALDELADRLRSDGHTAAVVTLPGTGDGDLAGQADALDAVVRTALASGTPSVDLVGYSAGGVVVRLWIARYAAARAARRVVTLGSPLHGASIAAVGQAVVPGACPTACQQLIPGSPLLSQLDAQSLPAGLPWLSVWTRDDQTVNPPESARLDGAVNVALQDICADANVQHGQLPTDPLVTGLILRDLDQPQALSAAPGPGECAALRATGQ
jgi:triacylglycerol esterase/lipase EstA (alpha/beta hydrolase family)